MELYSAIKRDEMMSFAERWTELESTGLSEISQTQKVKAQMCNLERKMESKDSGNPMKTEGGLVEQRKGTRGREEKRERGTTGEGYWLTHIVTLCTDT